MKTVEEKCEMMKRTWVSYRQHYCCLTEMGVVVAFWHVVLFVSYMWSWQGPGLDHHG